MKVLVFNNQAAATAALTAIDALALTWFQAQPGAILRQDEDGRTYVASVNSKTGLEEPDGRRTYSYHPDGPEQTGDGRWWVWSLTGQNPAWADWRATLVAQFPDVDLGAEVDLIDDWLS